MTPLESALFERWVFSLGAMEQKFRELKASADENLIVNGPSNSAAQMGAMAEIAKCVASGQGTTLPEAFDGEPLLEVPIELRRKACEVRHHFFVGSHKCARCGRSKWDEE